MKQRITVEQVTSLSRQAKQRLEEWYVDTLEFGDDLVHVYVPQEARGELGGVFTGEWDKEHEFIYPKRYIGKLSNHKGTILPLMDITLMLQFLEDHGQECAYTSSQTLCDSLWEQVKQSLSEKARRKA